MRTITIADKNNPSITYRYSTEPEEYADAIPYVIEMTDDYMRSALRLRPTGLYVPDAVDEEGTNRHPVHFRAERFSLRGALYRGASSPHFSGRRRLELHGPTLFHITQHHLRVAAACVLHNRPWSSHTLEGGEGVTSYAVSEIPLRDVEVEKPDEVLYEVLRTAGENVAATRRELVAIGEVVIPWPHRDRGVTLEDTEPTGR